MGYTAAAAANPRATSASHDKASQDFFGASRRPALTKQLTVCQKRFELSKLVLGLVDEHVSSGISGVLRCCS